MAEGSRWTPTAEDRDQSYAAQMEFVLGKMELGLRYSGYFTFLPSASHHQSSVLIRHGRHIK
jgi:hypothetical protein